MPDLTLAPGCFGGVIAFDLASEDCAQCPFAPWCEVAAAQIRVALEARGLLAPAARSKPKVKGEVAAIGMIETLPLKVRQLAERIDRKGIKVGESLRAGKNPFEDGPAFLKVACHLLLRMPGGVDRATLKIALTRKLGWKPDTAASHVGQVFHLFPALGAAADMNGRLIIKKD